jgi:flagellar biosynthesis/type III secretory pathway protein FliH
LPHRVSKNSRSTTSVCGKWVKGTSEQLNNQILGSMSQRGADMLREDMEALGPIKFKEVESAQQQIIAIVRQLESEGVVSLKGAVGEQYVVSDLPAGRRAGGRSRLVAPGGSGIGSGPPPQADKEPAADPSAQIARLEAQYQQKLREAHAAGVREAEAAGRNRAATEMQPVIERLTRAIQEIANLRARLRLRRAAQQLAIALLVMLPSAVVGARQN